MTEHGEPVRRITTQDLQEIWQLLNSIKEAQDKHLAAEAEIQPKLLELISILEKSKGALLFLKVLIYGGTLLGGLYVWAKEHLK